MARLPRRVAVKTQPATQWLAAAPPKLAAADTHRDDMAFWMYSSGSTGRPKGIVHLQHDMAYTHHSYARHLLQLGEGDICFSVPKIFFAYGLGNSLTFPFSVGASSVLLPGQPKPAAIFDAIARYRPTVFFGLPTLYTALTKAPEAAAPTCRACALPSPPRRSWRPRCSTPGRPCRASRSWRGSARPRCCTSTSPTRRR